MKNKKTNQLLAIILFSSLASLAFAKDNKTAKNVKLAEDAGLVKTLDHVAAETYGQNPLYPSDESILGQYIKRTGSKTVIRGFPTAPVGSTLPKREIGPEKLVVAVSDQTFDDFKKTFANKNFLYLYLESNGSMMASYNGKMGNGTMREDLSFRMPGTLIIPIVLSSTESERVENFFKLSEISMYAFRPYQLMSASGQPYSPRNGYEGCTNWFGELPMGDELVNTYINPRGMEDATGENPVTQNITQYVVPQEATKEEAELIKKVWTVPGHKQLGEVLESAANRRGEYANVGWIAYSLLGRISPARVPFVFLLVNDETQDIDPNFSLRIIEN